MAYTNRILGTQLSSSRLTRVESEPPARAEEQGQAPTDGGEGSRPEAQPRPPSLPPGIDVLWDRRGSGSRGPRRGLSIDARHAAIRLADADGLESVSMARVAEELGFTTMSLYRYVTSKDELLQLHVERVG